MNARFTRNRGSHSAGAINDFYQRIKGAVMFMKIGRFARLLEYSLIAIFVLTGAGPSRALAQEDHTHMIMSQRDHQTSEQKNQAGALIKVVRDATERFQNVSAAQAAGYYLQFGCVTGPDLGAMGMHFVNMALVTDGILGATRPEIVIYEPQ